MKRQRMCLENYRGLYIDHHCICGKKMESTLQKAEEEKTERLKEEEANKKLKI